MGGPIEHPIPSQTEEAGELYLRDRSSVDIEGHSLGVRPKFIEDFLGVR